MISNFTIQNSNSLRPTPNEHDEFWSERSERIRLCSYLENRDSLRLQGASIDGDVEEEL
jgi:hypothetical protein